MHSRFFCSLIALALLAPFPAWGQNAPKNGGDFSNDLQPVTKVPPNVILVKCQ